MGSLKPGATYIHERVDNVVYAREFGADPSTRQVVGWDYDKDNPNFDPLSHKNYMSTPRESQLWHEIRMAAETNPTIKSLLEQAKTAYYLSKEHDARHKERT